MEYQTPDVADDGILLRIVRAGVCGTDLEGIKGHRTLRFPVIPGHEVSAVVEKIGSQALKHTRVIGAETLREGDRVTINPRIVCGRCHYCRQLPGRQEMCLQASTYGSSLGSGRSPHILGGWAEYQYLLPGSEIIVLPEGISDDLAVLTEPFGVAAGLVDRFQHTHEWIAGDGFGMNRTVVVYGAGAIGILAAAAVSLAGASQVVMVDVANERLELSKAFGVTHMINPREVASVVDAVRDLTGGLGADIVIEACGVPQVIGQGVRLLRRGGTFFEVGHLANVGMAEIDPHYVCHNEIAIQGYYAYPTSQSLAYAAKLLSMEALPYRQLVHTVPLDEFECVFDEELRRATVKIAFAM